MKIIINPNVWVEVVSAKYLTKINVLEAKKTTQVSTMCKYVLDLIKKVYVESLVMIKGLISDIIFGWTNHDL